MEPGMNRNGTHPQISSTHSVHAGEARFRAHHSLTVPIVQTAVYTFDSVEELQSAVEEKMFSEEVEREEYGRYGNPTVRAAEAKLAALEGGEDAILVSSGMGAVTATLLLLLKPGDHLIATNESYLSTLDFCRNFLPRWGVEVSVIAHGDYETLEATIRPNTRVLLCESPTNPFNHCLDLDRVSMLAKTRGILTVIDATLATPVNIQPIKHGIDVVIHSATKYLGGHHDLLAGVVVSRYELTTPLRQMQGMLGNIAAPQTAYYILRGLKTLALRMERHNANGMALAQFLADHPKVKQVWYPGLEEHRDHALACQSMKGFGGVVSFEVEGDAEAAYRFIDALKVPTIGPSLGGTESMVSPLAIMGYWYLDQEEREALGIRDGLIRYCCGIEESADLIADAEQALALL